ncbi:MAG TPA: hypothetical protein VKX45_18030 [Bryobacteraceae bacterium]|jgi:bacteriorhodopsin|nr:hypothetical protein [Bryobacteraceae bacterium]
MSDRGFLFLFSIAMVLGGLGVAAWLLATGQADTVDGLFMMLVSLLVAAIFGLYLRFMIRRAMEEVAKPAAQPAKAASAPAKPTPATAQQA